LASRTACEPSANIEKLQADLENLRTNVEVLSGQNSQIKAQLQEREDELEKFKFRGPAADSLTNIENT
jgi:uncharacterized protein (DUF3084 family)